MPNRNRDRVGGQPEFEVAYYTKELGKTLQRKMLRQQLGQMSSSDAAGEPGAHGEESALQQEGALPRVDRAG
jgi:hypothetical protein